MQLLKTCQPAERSRLVAMGHNGTRLGEVGDFENETLKLLIMLNRNTNVQ
jgi:hypothetical protein